MKTDIEIKRIKIGKWYALAYFDTENNVVTMCHDGEGGPIVSSTSLEDVKSKFKEAMSLADATRKLLEYKATGKFTD